MTTLNPHDKFYAIRKNFKTQIGIHACPRCAAPLRLYLTPTARVLRFAECTECNYALLIPKPRPPQPEPNTDTQTTKT